MTTMGDVANGKSARTRSLVDALVRWLFNLWESHTDFSDAGTAELIRDSVDAVEETLVRARQEEDAYQEVVLRALGRRFPDGVPPADRELYPRQNKIPEEVWARPVFVYRKARQDGASPAEARLRALGRVRELAEADIKMAQRERASRILQSAAPQGVIGYRRIIHPERSKTGTCGLCLVAANRIYSTGELYPLHTGCQCEVLPITEEHDPGLHLNREDLDAIYRIAGSTGASDLSNTRIKEYVSGEWGSVLRKHDRSTASGLSPRDEKFALPKEDAQRYSRVSDPERMVRRLNKSRSELGEWESRRGSASRSRKSNLEKTLEYWEKMAG